MKNTTYYNLKKPESADYYNIEDQNANMDIIDVEISNKVDKIDGKGLSTEDYTTVEKNKLAQIYDWATGLFSLKSHHHDTVYEKTIMKKSGFNLEKSDSVSNSSSSVLATLNAVKTAYDKAVSAYNLASSKLGVTAKAADSDKLDGKDSTAFASSGHNHDSRYEQIMSKKSGFNLDKSDSVTSSSTSTLATSAAVRISYNKAVEAINISNSKLDESYGNTISTTTSFTLNVNHRNSVICAGSTSNQVITIPIGVFNKGDQITVIRSNTPKVTITPSSGFSLFSANNKRSIRGKYAGATIIFTSDKTGYLIGALE